MLENTQNKDAVFIYGDIRGFSAWSIRNQPDIHDFIEKYYDIVLQNFPSASESLRRKVVKFLGDGFFSVIEYDKKNPQALPRALYNAMFRCQHIYSDFTDFKKATSLHGIDSLGIGFGISYGNALRFNLPGGGIDYVGEKVNFASRLCGAAQAGTIYGDADVRKQIGALLDDETEIYEEGLVPGVSLKGYSNTTEPEKIYSYKLRKTRKNG
jgi:class 3 adenylate cyclase